MNVRDARPSRICPALEALWRAFEAEVPPPAHEEVDEARELGEIREIVESGFGWVAERDGDASSGWRSRAAAARASGASPTSSSRPAARRTRRRRGARRAPWSTASRRTGWRWSTSR